MGLSSVEGERRLCKIGLIKNMKGCGIVGNTNYYNQFEENTTGFFKVVFINNATGDKLVRGFDSPWFAMRFVNKCKRSKKVTLVSYPLIEWA